MPTCTEQETFKNPLSEFAQSYPEDILACSTHPEFSMHQLEIQVPEWKTSSHISCTLCLRTWFWKVCPIMQKVSLKFMHWLASSLRAIERHGRTFNVGNLEWRGTDTNNILRIGMLEWLDWVEAHVRLFLRLMHDCLNYLPTLGTYGGRNTSEISTRSWKRRGNWKLETGNLESSNIIVGCNCNVISRRHYMLSVLWWLRSNLRLCSSLKTEDSSRYLIPTWL